MYSSYRDRGLLIWVFLKQEPDCAKVKERSALTKEGALVGTAPRGNTTTDPSLFSIPKLFTNTNSVFSLRGEG
jgi:hypothetical protein